MPRPSSACCSSAARPSCSEPSPHPSPSPSPDPDPDPSQARPSCSRPSSRSATPWGCRATTRASRRSTARSPPCAPLAATAHASSPTTLITGARGGLVPTPPPQQPRSPQPTAPIPYPPTPGPQPQPQPPAPTHRRLSPRGSSITRLLHSVSPLLEDATARARRGCVVEPGGVFSVRLYVENSRYHAPPVLDQPRGGLQPWPASPTGRYVLANRPYRSCLIGAAAG